MTNQIQYNFDKAIDRVNTNAVKWDLRELYFKSNDILPFWVADMDFETPDFILANLEKRLKHPVLGYTFRPESFNQSFIDWAERKYNWCIDKSWLHFSPGVVSAVTLAVLAFTQPGDEVIVQNPVYFPFFRCIEGTHRVMKFNPLVERNARFHMDLAQLKNTISDKTKMLILCNPHNPGGSAWTAQELKDLGQVCAAHDIMVVSDEIHADLVFSPHKHIPFAKAVPQDQVRSLTTMAASKSFNLAGLSTSIVVMPDQEVYTKFDEMLQTIHINMGNIFGSIATETAYAQGWDWLHQLMSYLKTNRDYLVDFISSELPELKIFIPEATYLAWIDFSALGYSDDKLRYILVEKAKIGLSPGTMFGPGGEGYMRFNFACPKSMMEEGLGRMKQTIRELRKK